MKLAVIGGADFIVTTLHVWGDAVKTQSRETAVKALTLHPLVNSYSLAKQLVDRYDGRMEE